MRSAFPGRDVDRLYAFIRLGELVRYPDVDLRAFPVAARRLKGRYCALFPGSDIGEPYCALLNNLTRNYQKQHGLKLTYLQVNINLTEAYL